MNEISRNEVELEGIVSSAPEFSHENHGTRFDRFYLQVPRLSGQTDLLPVLMAEDLPDSVSPGAFLHIRGQLRSFNNKSGQGSRLVLSVLAQTAEPGTGDVRNVIVLSGLLCKAPILRQTPLGRSICDLMLAVTRRYGRVDYLPVIAWGQLAVGVSSLHVGDRITLEGRVQSRSYVKATETGAENRTAYEISVMHLLENTDESCSG